MANPNLGDTSTSSSILELEARLKELEARFLGPETVPSERTVISSPFAPISAIRQRIESFHLTQPDRSSETVSKKENQTRLPPLPLPTFDGSDLEPFLKEWQRWLRLTGVQDSADQVKLDWLLECCSPKVRKLVDKVIEESEFSLLTTLMKLEMLFPRLENDITLREKLEKLFQLPAQPGPAAVAPLS